MIRRNVLQNLFGLFYKHPKKRTKRLIRLAVLVLIQFYILKSLFRIFRPRFSYDKHDMKLTDVTIRRATKNSSCIILSCSTHDTIGIEDWWHYYNKFGYTVSMIQFEDIMLKDRKIHPVWCRIPMVMRELEKNIKSRVLYLDIDSKVDPGEWCNLPNTKFAPIVMNSYTRGKVYDFKDYSLSGTHVQANSFIVRSGKDGIRAMKRWRNQYYEGQYYEQGAIHLQEKGLCGVPGWIACYSNYHQQKCHCPAIKEKERKKKCVKDLFSGRKKDCPI